MKTNEKQIVVFAIIFIAAFICGSLVTTTFTSKNAYSIASTQAQASFWDKLFGRVQADEITEIADVIRLVLDQIDDIHDLETRIAVLEKCGPECEYGFPPPDYDSGWHPILPSSGRENDLTLHHNLNTLDYLVYVVSCEDTPSGSEQFTPTEFHNFGTGGAFIEDYVIDKQISSGTYWYAAKNSITIHRYPNDTVSKYIRVMLWKIPQ